MAKSDDSEVPLSRRFSHGTDAGERVSIKKGTIESVGVRERSPFLPGPARSWEIASGIVFPCAGENRRRVQGRGES